MVEVLGVLDNREKAALIWIALAITVALRSKQIRSSLVSVLKTVLSRTILMVLAATVSYLTLIVFGLHQLGFWDLSLTKDTLIWFLGPALLMVFNHGEAIEDAAYFKKTLAANLRLALVLEFFISFYVFYLFVELLFLPVMFVLTGMLVVSESKTEYAQVKGFLEILIAAVGLSLLSYALAMLIFDHGSFLTGDSVRLFALPIVLTVLFLPFLYALVIYGRYERSHLLSQRRSVG